MKWLRHVVDGVRVAREIVQLGQKLAPGDNPRRVLAEAASAGDLRETLKLLERTASEQRQGGQ